MILGHKLSNHPNLHILPGTANLNSHTVLLCNSGRLNLGNPNLGLNRPIQLGRRTQEMELTRILHHQLETLSIRLLESRLMPLLLP